MFCISFFLCKLDIQNAQLIFQKHCETKMNDKFSLCFVFVYYDENDFFNKKQI